MLATSNWTPALGLHQWPPPSQGGALSTELASGVWKAGQTIYPIPRYWDAVSDGQSRTFQMVAREGIEPPTRGFEVRRSVP